MTTEKIRYPEVVQCLLNYLIHITMNTSIYGVGSVDVNLPQFNICSTPINDSIAFENLSSKIKNKLFPITTAQSEKSSNFNEFSLQEVADQEL